MEESEPTTSGGVSIQLACGHVEVLHLLGQGASSRVWLVERQGQNCALKVGDPTSAELLASEATRLVLARSAFLPRALDVGFLPRLPVANVPLPDAGAPYLLLSFAEGVPLNQVWAGDAREASRLERLGTALARDIGQALADLHAAGLAHGDVKPENIIVEARGAEFRCTLVDLGMATDADSEWPQGATPRYLPPNLEPGGLGDARSRDLWALGLCLLETLSPEARNTSDPLPHLTVDLERHGAWLAPLLALQAGARPRASWVARRAGSMDRQQPAHVERSYLATRWSELERITETTQITIELPGLAGDWLRSACHILQRCAVLRPPRTPQSSVVLRSLKEHKQRDWLLRLVGTRIVDFPPLAADGDDTLAESLCESARYAPLESLSFAEISRRVRPELRQAPEDRHELALLLGAEAPSDGVLDAAESWCLEANTPSAIRIATARALKRRAELGRALAVLRAESSPSATLESASVYARMGALDTAAALLEHTLVAHTSAAQNPDAVALLARIRLHQGNTREAERLIRGQVRAVSVLETQASIALTAGDLAVAAELLSDALGYSEDAEQQARLQALTANLRQQLGDPSGALTHFRRAAEHAARAGALLEEATYCIGVAGTALELGESAQALLAAQRATLLLDHLQRPNAAARSQLTQASALVSLGALSEAADAANDCLARARAASDRRCEAFCHLVLSDIGTPDALHHVRLANELLTPLRDDDRLRVAARELSLRADALDGHAIEECDALANSSLPAEARYEWWTARAARRASSDDGSRVDTILAGLDQLRSSETPVEPRGRAFALGAQLAALASDGERARAFTEIASSAFDRLSRGAPEELRASLRRAGWVRGLTVSESTAHFNPEQLRQLQQMLESLGQRDRLRPLLIRIVDALVLWTGVERGLLLLRTPDGKLAARAARNLARHDLTPEQRKLSTSLAERALNSGECVIAIDASGELPSFHQSVHLLKLRSVLAVPLRARGDTLGVVYLDDRVRRGAFGRSELEWVRLVASLAAIAIADTRDQLVLRRAVRKAQLAEAHLATALQKTRSVLRQKTRELDRERPLRNRERFAEIIGESSELHALLGLVDRVADADVPVLIRGESGSGKELVARALHRNSARHKGPFVAENCSAIPETLLESTLFGHVKGAFTGAIQRHAGLFEMADGGTLFLDEIADMSLGMQAKVLRVLESGELRRIGSEKATQVNVRVLGASHRNLEDMAKSGAFREDLLYRLNVVTIEIPPLRKRVGDIEVLIQHFLKRHGGPTPPELSVEAAELLTAYPWPGNIRQLENELRRAIVLSDGVIRPRHLSPTFQQLGAHSKPDPGLNLRARVDVLEAQLICEALKQSQGNQTRAAQILGISRFGLQKMLKRLGLSAQAGQGNQVAVTDS